METRELLGYTLEIVMIEDFKEYYYGNISRFSTFSFKAFLKGIDIPSSYFLEQPEDTREILLNNKEEFMKGKPKYKGKCLILIVKDNSILNVSRINRDKLETSCEQLSSLVEVKNLVPHKEFLKDGIVTYFVPKSEAISKGGYTEGLLVEIPILLHKKSTINHCYFKMSSESTISNVDKVFYTASSEVDFNQYQHIALAVEEEKANFVTTNIEEMKDPLLRETEVVVGELVENKVIPKNYFQKISNYVNNKSEHFTLTYQNFTELVLEFEDNFNTIKAVSHLRTIQQVLDDSKYNTDLKSELVEVI